MSLEQNLPYANLGDHLRTLRKKLQESLAEVSGAVEIDEDVLLRMEQGSERPSEDVLALLISHFDMPEDDASHLWELAGYEFRRDDDGPEPEFTAEARTGTIPQAVQSVVMGMIFDPRVMYSDGVDVLVDKQGLTLHFTQAGPNSTRLPVARVGMSHEQALDVFETFANALLEIKEARRTKNLPAPKQDKKSSRKSQSSDKSQQQSDDAKS